MTPAGSFATAHVAPPSLLNRVTGVAVELASEDVLATERSTGRSSCLLLSLSTDRRAGSGGGETCPSPPDRCSGLLSTHGQGTPQRVRGRPPGTTIDQPEVRYVSQRDGVSSTWVEVKRIPYPAGEDGLFARIEVVFLRSG
jgi:hypothetical protein